MKYFIIGNGIAGTEAALNIIKNDDNADITIVTDSDYYHYYRPGLIDFIAGEKSLDKIIMHDEKFYADKNIKIKLSTHIESMNKETRTVKDSNNVEYSYDRLLIAAGSSPFIIPVPGNDKKNIFTLRGIRDAETIISQTAKAKEICVIGGGLLGLETASSLASEKRTVTVLENAEWLLPRQLDRQGGKILERMLLKKNIKIETGISVREFTGESEKADKTILSDEKTLNTDMVIISAGICPGINFVKQAGIKTGTGIIIDNYMRTSDENIFAAGDIAEHNGKIYGLWITSKEQGKAAGLNMAGIETEYNGSIPSSSLKVSGIDLFSAGDIHDNGNVYSREEESCYIKLISNGSEAKGLIALGNSDAVKAARGVMNGKTNPEEFIVKFSLKQKD